MKFGYKNSPCEPIDSCWIKNRNLSVRGTIDVVGFEKKLVWFRRILIFAGWCVACSAICWNKKNDWVRAWFLFISSGVVLDVSLLSFYSLVFLILPSKVIIPPFYKSGFPLQWCDNLRVFFVYWVFNGKCFTNTTRSVCN